MGPEQAGPLPEGYDTTTGHPSEGTWQHLYQPSNAVIQNYRAPACIFMGCWDDDDDDNDVTDVEMWSTDAAAFVLQCKPS